MNSRNYLNIFERYLDGNASPEEITELRTFLENDSNLNDWIGNQIFNSPDNVDAGTKLKILDNIRSQAGYSLQMPAENKKVNFRYYLRKISNVAAVLLPVVIILGIYLYLKPVQAEPFEIIADLGTKAGLALPDGSKVSINSGTRMTYYSDYNKKDRILKLNGEAYLEVSSDPEKPFIVDCGDIKIKVLGTSFGIKAYQDEDYISVVLNSGKIQLITPREEIEMKPKERIVYSKETQTITFETVNPEDFTGWRQNRLRFENESLETMMKAISRMHNIDIVFESPELKNQRFTGTIDNTDIESVLSAIRLTSSVGYRVNQGIVYLYQAK